MAARSHNLLPITTCSRCMIGTALKCCLSFSTSYPLCCLDTNDNETVGARHKQRHELRFNGNKLVSYTTPTAR